MLYGITRRGLFKLDCTYVIISRVANFDIGGWCIFMRYFNPFRMEI